MFDLRRPYFSFDTANNYTQTGTTRSQGAEFSVSGNLTPRLGMVAGGFVLRPRITRDANAVGTIGKRPVGLPDHLFNFNLNWRTPMLEGLLARRRPVPPRHRRCADRQPGDHPFPRPAQPGGRYQFKLAGKSATFRLQAGNIFDQQGFGTNGPGLCGEFGTVFDGVPGGGCLSSSGPRV